VALSRLSLGGYLQVGISCRALTPKYHEEE